MPVTRAQWITGALVIAGLAVGSVVSSRLPDPAQAWQAPFPESGAVGDRVGLRTAWVTVESVAASTTVRSPTNEVAATPGTFLVLDLEYEARLEAWSLSEQEIRTPDGRRFGGSQVVRPGCSGQPGIPVACQVVFELPADALEGAHFWAPPDGKAGGDGDTTLDIDLGIDAARAGELAASTTPIRTRFATPKGT